MDVYDGMVVVDLMENDMTVSLLKTRYVPRTVMNVRSMDVFVYRPLLSSNRDVVTEAERYLGTGGGFLFGTTATTYGRDHDDIISRGLVIGRNQAGFGLLALHKIIGSIHTKIKLTYGLGRGSEALTPLHHPCQHPLLPPLPLLALPTIMLAPGRLGSWNPENG